jgi:hypothetical protein
MKQYLLLATAFVAMGIIYSIITQYIQYEYCLEMGILVRKNFVIRAAEAVGAGIGLSIYSLIIPSIAWAFARFRIAYFQIVFVPSIIVSIMIIYLATWIYWSDSIAPWDKVAEVCRV